MIIYTTNMTIFALPVLLVIWALELYLFLVLLRLILQNLSGEKAQQFCQGLRQFTDYPPQLVNRRLSGRSTPPWVGWAVVIVGAIVTRYVLICFILSVVQKGGHPL